MAVPTKSKYAHLTPQQRGSLPPKPGNRPRGAPKGNSNGSGTVRHGLRAGLLPKGCKYIEVQVNKLRRTLEEAVVECKGNVSLCDAACIQTAVKWERHGALCLRWLRLKADELKPLEVLTFSRDIAKASTERDKALAMLKLDAPPKVLTLEAHLAAKDAGP